MIIGGIYRSPNNSKSNNTLLFETIYTASQLNKDNILLMGDFNCSGIKWEDISTTDQNTESLSFKLIETIRDCFLHQVIMENTRARGTNNPSLLDLVLCYDAMLINNIEYHSPLGKSDHSVIYYNYQIECMKCTYKIKKTFYDKGDYKAIQEYLKEIDWKQMFIGKGVQQMWDLLVETLKECEARFIPNKIVEINGDAKYKETLNITIRKNIKQKHNLWKRYMETRSPVVYGKYCRMRNKVKNMIKYTRKQKEKQISGNIKNNPKAFWKYTKSKTKSSSAISSLHLNPSDTNSITVDNSKVKANILNEYFASVFTKEPNGDFCELEQGNIDEQSQIYIRKLEVKKLLNELKTCKSQGPDGLHPRLLHELANEIYLPLSIIFEASMKSIKIPKQWKIARVSAIHKKGNRKLASNYRPVSITSIVCRVLETIIRNFMVEFLVSNDLLSDFQFGFVKGRSTTVQLLNVLNDWTNSLENKLTTDCIYLDYQKAFDSVPHKRLISKLRSYRFNPVIISWVENYLRDRSQYVEINGEQSQWQPVTSGIPQGSVLGPLLFLIYINDLPKHVNSTIYMYADDTKIYREIRDKHDQEILQKDLDSLKAWSDQWLLKFHPKKCYSITIGKKEDNDYTYCITDNGTKYDMTQINDMKDIGVIIDSDLKFEKHINSKIGTANKILGIIRRAFMYLSAEVFIPLYKAMVRSHFDYAMIIWNPHTVKYIESIEGVQRRATKMIPEIKKLSYPERLKYLRLPTMAYRRARGDMIEVYKIIKEIYDSKTTCNILKYRDKIHLSLRGHNYILEHKRLYNPTRVNFFANRVVNNWNSLPEYIVEAGSLNIFKNSLDRLWSNQDLLYNYRGVIEKKDNIF